MPLISIKKYLDADTTVAYAEPDPLLAAAFGSYRSALRTIGRAAVEACPVTGRELLQQLETLEQTLSPDSAPAAVEQTEQQVEKQLNRWGDQTAEHFKARTDEVKELLLMLARTSESVGERDQRYAGQFSGLTADLRAVANLDDLTQVRVSVLRKAAELKTCVDAMAEDGRQTIAEMRSRVSGYEEKLRCAEELASRDPLTGLANRRGVEGRMAWWSRFDRIFTVIMIDLNGFKQLNDRHGHQAGDELLRHFAQELQGKVRADDLVGRWGGDEFLIVTGSSLEEAQHVARRIRQWVFGEYTIHSARGREPLKVRMDAAVGLAQWSPGLTLEELLKQADIAMYADKRSSEGRRA